MTNYAKSAGDYTGTAVSWEVRNSNGGNVGIKVVFDLTEKDERPLDEPLRASGTFWTLRQDGTINEKVCAMLERCLGWDGTFAQVGTAAPDGRVLHLSLEEKDHNGKTYCDVRWMRVPGSAGDRPPREKPDTDALDKQHASKIKAALRQAKKDEKPVDDDTIPF